MKGDRHLSACSEKIVRAILAAWNFPRAGVSGAAELHQVKCRAKEFAAHRKCKKKKARHCRAF
jgi:hypothetical protein